MGRQFIRLTRDPFKDAKIAIGSNGKGRGQGTVNADDYTIESSVALAMAAQDFRGKEDLLNGN